MGKQSMLALTQSQYETIINAVKTGFSYTDAETGKEKTFRPNERLATALTVEAVTGLRIGDIVKLKLADIVRDGNRYRLDITEEKTGKKRRFTITDDIKDYLMLYAVRAGRKENEKLFPVTTRAISKQLKIVANYLSYERTGTHSFRKLFATNCYENSGCDIELTRRLLQHSTSTVTQRYIGVEPERIETALKNHVKLI